MEKHYIQADQLLKDSYNLAWKIYEQGFKPDFILENIDTTKKINRKRKIIKLITTTEQAQKK
jgi:hypothetical protein